MKKNMVISIIIVVILFSIGIYIVVTSRINANYIPNYTLEDFYEMPERKVGVNEYKVSSVDEEEMVSIYFNTYTSLLFENISMAYSLLDETSQLEVYPNLDSFKKKVASLTNDFNEIPKIDRYELVLNDGKKKYTISDQKGNIYIFNVEAVMKYTVTLE